MLQGELLPAYWLEEACQRVAQGVQLLSCSTEVSRLSWVKYVLPEVPHLETKYGMWIRAKGDAGEVKIQVARYPWVFSLLDLATTKGSLTEAAMLGVLQGHDAETIEKQIRPYEEDQHVY